ncbi:ArpU family phage packaging/lysis transcriptional regulator [Halalkalibacterium halodurans]|uniref:ArpU family phage packaging/lysis transcriptional regulator n=1 Tax=Halalkalibacterium halodurans TaxID=86665 RepID=UPI002AA9FB35|nr:ArpU family phage packaging/lysis transcriptional regulator [Halalkalibacterium halodurans]MDY7222119.1 ArpU family phage packaging/lysis transcriptional regulator [Halalkalibacterium halodurans]MDY7243923.1 ArpU family phage packaging/lysis transcriptional regulator [Halalkalibacterium halodurans]
MSFDLPELDQKKTKEAVEAALEKYRLFKYLTFEEREASITASPDERFHGPTNQTSDQTAQVAIYNADQQEYRRQYCERIERAVKRLPPLERFLIERRYMAEDADYKTDMQVYCFEFQPPMSESRYSKIRWRAFYKLALNLNIAVTK